MTVFFYIVKKFNCTFSLINKEGEKSVSFNDLLEKWNGIILLFTDISNAEELDYTIHKKQGIALNFVKVMALAGVAFLFFYLFLIEARPLTYLFLLLMNAIGLVLSLVLADLGRAPRFVRSMCGTLTKEGCKKVSSSRGSNVLGFSLAELGVSFYSANIIFCLSFPNHENALYGIFILLMPFYIWSVLYQKFEIHAWCTLCICVMSVNLIICCFAIINGVHFERGMDYMMIVFGYAITLPVTHRLYQLYRERMKLRREKEEWSGLKYSSRNFVALVKASKKIEEQPSNIIIGGHGNKTTVTLILNPLCNPCAVFYQQFYKNIFPRLVPYCKVNIVWLGFEGYEDSVKFMISKYGSDTAKAAEFYYHWYQKYRFHFKEYLARERNPTAKFVNDEWQLHVRWQRNPLLHGTPEVLVNGHVLPDCYTVEDLPHFVDIF